MKGKCAIEYHEWSISKGRQQFLLSEREIDEIDICLADATYAFSIDAKFESDLNEARIATDRRQIFSRLQHSARWIAMSS